MIEDFTMPGPNGTLIAYYNYRYWIALGIVVNSIVTILFEKTAVVYLTNVCDRRQRQQKLEAFESLMDAKL